jgi:hypothetical protein
MFTDTLPFDFQRRHCPHHYLAHYITGHSEDDPLSKSLIGFKKGRFTDLVSWLSCAKSEIAALNLLAKGLIVRALHSYEANRQPFKNRPLAGTDH